MVQPGTVAKVTCTIFGYPTAAVTWSYIPCVTALFDAVSCEKDPNQRINFTVRIFLDVEFEDMIHDSKTFMFLTHFFYSLNLFLLNTTNPH